MIEPASRRLSRALRWGAVLLVLALLGGAVFLSVGARPAAPPDARWLPVRAQPLENRLGLSGRIEPATRLSVAAPFEGVLRRVDAREGERVAAGQILLRLDTAQLSVQLRQALADLLKARRAAQEMRDWPRGAEVARARRAVTSAQMNLQDIEAKLADTRRLFERGIVARMEVDALEQQLRSQRLDLAASQAELRAVQERGQGAMRRIAEMELANAQARYDGLREQEAQSDLRAPFAGIVLPRPKGNAREDAPIQAGARVTPGMPLFELASLDRVQAVASVEEADLHQLREGMPVSITGDGFKGLTLHGRIARLGAQGMNADRFRGSAAYEVVVAIDPLSPAQQQRVRLGMSACLSIVTYRVDSGFAVPGEALRRDGEGRYFVVHRPSMDAPPARVIVQPGRAVPQGVEVAGIGPGFVALP
jgi:multidrug efflux pump subunit AcrA (membrane-fusion protein)